MKRILSTLLSICVVMFVLSNNVFSLSSNFDNRTCVVISAGQDKVGIIDHSEQEPLAPDSFYVTPDKHFYILDSVNNKVIHCFDNSIQAVVPIATSGLWMQDILVTYDYFYILLFGNRLLQTDHMGHIVKTTDLSDFVDTECLLSSDGKSYTIMSVPIYIDILNNSLVVICQDGRVIDINTGLCILNVNLSIKNESFEDICLGNGSSIKLPSFSQPIAQHRIITSNENMICYTSEISYTLSGTYMDRRIYFMNDLGIEKFVQLEPTIYTVPNRFFRVTYDGAVYQMITGCDSISIVELEESYNFDTTPSYMIKNKLMSFSEQQNSTIDQNMSILSVTSKSVAYNNAQNMINYNWLFNPATHGNQSQVSPLVVKPVYLNGLTSITSVTGIPYCWGGSRGINTSYQASTFPQTVASGMFTGNCSSAIFQNNTSGVDCSGYVSVAYELGQKYSTNTLVGTGKPFYYYTPLSPSYMDIFNAAGDHVFIFTGSTVAGGRQYIFLQECTTTANYRGHPSHIDKTVAGGMYLDTLPSSYKLAKYRYWN